MRVDLHPHQIKAVKEMKNGCILWGGVGSGKSITAIYYWFCRVCGGRIRTNDKGDAGPFASGRDLYIITTAKKRDKGEWWSELAPFGISSERENSFGYVQVTVDSWHNILQYKDVKNAFFIFDEQRLVGSGAWVKAFLKIAKHNQWIILSATPGDNWSDYIPIFLAHGFYRTRGEFAQRHIKFAPYTNFPKIERYLDTNHLERLRNQIRVEMPFERQTVRHLKNIIVSHNEELLNKVVKDRWNIYEDQPIQNAAELFYLMRRVVNSDDSRIQELKLLLSKHPRLIVFYNFNYELIMLRDLSLQLGIPTAEWNGQKHQEIPKTESWLYLVQYTAGAEGWNCIETDAMVFFSLNYSYKIFEQAQGRTDRMNTPFTDLYYYVLRSAAKIDTAITKAIATKKTFNERTYASQEGLAWE